MGTNLLHDQEEIGWEAVSLESMSDNQIWKLHYTGKFGAHKVEIPADDWVSWPTASPLARLLIFLFYWSIFFRVFSRAPRDVKNFSPLSVYFHEEKARRIFFLLPLDSRKRIWKKNKNKPPSSFLLTLNTGNQTAKYTDVLKPINETKEKTTPSAGEKPKSKRASCEFPSFQWKISKEFRVLLPTWPNDSKLLRVPTFLHDKEYFSSHFKFNLI